MKLNELFPNWDTGNGIFSALQGKGVPWESENIATLLDLEFHGNTAGEKLISPLLRKLSVNGELTATSIDAVANLIMSLYGRNWGKLWDTLSFDYDPIENYSMTEHMTDDKTVTEYGRETKTERDNTHGKEGGETLTRDMSQTVKDDIIKDNKTVVDGETGLTVDTTESNDGKNAVYGFNSSDPVPTGTQEQDATGKRTENGTTDETRTESGTTDETRTQTDTGTDKTTYDVTETDLESGSVKEGGSDTQTRNYTLTRAGNIGVTTSQQMIESERNLWFWNFFIDTVFPNVADVLTLKIY